MEDISNRTLATLLIAAIVITLGGTLVSLNKLGQIGGPAFFSATGRATTDTGRVNVTIQSSQSIKLNVQTIDFGQGNVNASIGACSTGGVNLTTVGSGTNDNACWVVNNAVPLINTRFQVENDGTVDVNITITGGTNQTFITTSGDPENTTYKWQITSGTSSTCETAGNTGWRTFSENATLCRRLPWEDETPDHLDVDVWLRFPTRTTSGLFSDTVTFTANPAN